MALLIRFCTCMLLLLVSVLQAQGQHEDCSVVNNNPSIKENNDPGVVVTNITTAAGITVTIDPTMDYKWFEINGSQLILKDSVDYENTTVLIVQLNCWSVDMGTTVNNLIVVLTIENVNDNVPVFKETNITVHISEDTKVNTVVVPQANVTATDADGDIIFYNLTGNTTELEYFNIQGINNPQIVLYKALDYETINFMEFILYAMDGNNSATALHTATAEITIHILQADRRPPWFQPCTLTVGHIVCINHGYTGKVNISERMTEPVILKPGPLYAIDGDRDLNATIVYDIVDGNENNTFFISKYTGNITMNKTVDILKTFTLYVVASQENNPFRYSQTTVEIEVVHRNYHKPYFNTSYSGTISVQSPVSSIVMEAGNPSVPIMIFAVDEDFPPHGFNPDIQYKIQNSSAFRVTSDGFLLTTEVLKVASTVMLWAIAEDKVTLEEASTVIAVDVTPLAAATTPATTTSTTTTATITSSISSTTAFSANKGTGTTTSRPSSSSSSLPPGINSTLPIASSGSTKSTTPLTVTTKTADIMGTTGKPLTVTSGSVISPFITTMKLPIITVNTSQPQTTTSPITGISQLPPVVKPTTGTIKSTAQPSQSGTTNSSSTIVSGTASGTAHSTSLSSSETRTTKSPIPTTSRNTQSTAQTFQSGTTRPSTIGLSTTSSRTVSFTSLSSSETRTTKSPIPTTSRNTKSTAQTFQSGTTRPSTTGLSTTPSRTVSFTSLSSSEIQTTKSPTPDENPTTSHKTQSTVGTNQNETSSITGGTVPYDEYVRNMAALGGTLGSLLVIAVVLLGVISYKYYKMKHTPGEDNSKSVQGFSNAMFGHDEKLNSDRKDDKLPLSAKVAGDNPGPPSPPEDPEESSHTSSAPEAIAETEEENEGLDNEKEVRSILTKERRVADDGYKAVWFKKDIDPEAKDDVVVIDEDSEVEQRRNESDSDNADDRDGSGDDDDDDEDNDSGRGGSDVSVVMGRAQLPETINDVLEDGEASDIYF
ncbi:cadherin-related family member 5 [Pogona vitticeps]